MKRQIVFISLLILTFIGYIAYAGSIPSPIESIMFQDANRSGTITLIPPDADSSNVTLTLPNETGTILTNTSVGSTYQSVLTDSEGLAGALDDETGTESAVFNTSPTLVTPVLGTITSGVGTALTALDGEQLQDNTVDDDSIDFADVTCVDLTMSDCGAVTVSGTTNGMATGFTTYTPGITSDPCGTFPTGAVFYNSSANEHCACDGSNDVRIKDYSTACF